MSSPASWRAPEHAPAASSNLRRSFTLPSRPNVRSASTPPAASSSSDGIETLFVCSQSKIVSFTSTGPPRRLSPVRGISPPRSTAWTSPTERTLAVGPLRIYRVTASNVSFLNSGNLLHTIFPRSQCWCVDDQSIFVLRIRQDSYYRIELPFETDQDKETITQFTAALRQVLQYEKTQCPFKRGFKTEAPERPQSPPRKTFKRRPSQTKAKKWILDKTWVPESRPGTANSVFDGSDCGTASSYDDDDRSSVITDSSEAVPDHLETVPGRAPPKTVRRPSVAERASIFQGLRSVTAPVGSDRTASAVSMHRIPEESPKKEKAQEDVQKPILERHISEADSLASSADSFYSLATSNDHNPPTPFLDAEEGFANPWSKEKPRGDESRGRSTHRRQVSEMTVRVPSVQDRQEPNPTTPTARFHHHVTSPSNFQPSSAPSTPPLVSDSDDDSLELPGLDVATPPDAIRMKRLTGASQRRAFSPMPNPKNLFIPPKQPQTLGAQFTQAIVRKTMELVLGPPAHLVSLMLRIAASISNGFGFNTYRIRQTEKPPGSWESDDEEDWPEEDDFGIPLANLGESAHRRQTFSGELD